MSPHILMISGTASVETKKIGDWQTIFFTLSVSLYRKIFCKKCQLGYTSSVGGIFEDIILVIDSMKTPSVADIVFLMIASTLCYLAIIGKATVEQFMSIAGVVFGAYYTHKAQNKSIDIISKQI